jgi:hypothetical protein
MAIFLLNKVSDFYILQSPWVKLYKNYIRTNIDENLPNVNKTKHRKRSQMDGPKSKQKEEITNWVDDTPPNSLMDSTTRPKVKTMEGEGVGTSSLARNISGVERRAGAPRWD